MGALEGARLTNNGELYATDFWKSEMILKSASVK